MNTFTTQPLEGIKIARISTVPFFIVTQLKSQIEFLRDNGGEIVLISSHGEEISQINLCKKVRYKIITISRQLSPWRDIIAFIQLCKFFHSEKFHIVHSTTPKAGLLTAIAAYITGVPIRLHTFTGQPWLTMRNPLLFITRMCDKIIGVLNTKCYADSASQAQFLINERIIPLHKIKVIGKGSIAGVDLKRFSIEQYSKTDKNRLKQSLQLLPDALVLLYVGRITKDKGINELIYAFDKVLKMGKNIELLLVGPTDSDCGGSETIAIENISRTSRVHLLGYCKNPEKFMAISDILCLPSYREGFGTVVIEAAAMGIPTLGTEIDGLRDAVENGVTGILVPPKDGDALAMGLLRMVESPMLVKKMGDAAKDRCYAFFDANNVNGDVVKEYLIQLSPTNQ